LYLAGVISYPRTSSQKIPKEIEYDKILKRLKKEFSFAKFASRKTPIEGKKSDPAHPSIYPTGEFHELDGDDEKIYNLIVKRFISCFCDDSVLDNKKINVVVEGLKFNTKGIAIVEKGWMNVYPSNVEEVEIPDMEGKVNVDKCDIEEKLTQPPKRYSPASIISTLEKKNLGTKATRSSILETLYDRGYIKDKSIKATSLGISLIQSLEKNCPIIIEEKLTRDIENSLEDIRNAKSPLKEEEKILEDTKKIIYKIGEKFEENEEQIGKDLVAATERLWAEQKKENEIMDCKVCDKGKLGIRYGKQYKRYFVACDNYPDCKTTYGLPPNGLMKKTEKICEECGFPMLMALRKGKRPWIFCFNPECASRKKKEE
jgi:DNA topoisomerase-1